MHMYHIAHLDISLRNLLSDNNGHYCYIDFEMSRRFDLPSNPSHSHSNNTKAPQCQPDGPRISGYRGTEIPPEVELGQETDPFKVDVWAFGVLILRLAEVNVQPEIVFILYYKSFRLLLAHQLFSSLILVSFKSSIDILVDRCPITLSLN